MNSLKLTRYDIKILRRMYKGGKLNREELINSVLEEDIENKAAKKFSSIDKLCKDGLISEDGYLYEITKTGTEVLINRSRWTITTIIALIAASDTFGSFFVLLCQFLCSL